MGIAHSLVAIILMGVIVSADAELLVGFSKHHAKARLGDAFAIDIVISDAPNTEGGGVSMNYDSTIVNVIGVSVDAVTWDFVNKDGSIDNAKGQVSDVLFSSFRGVNGNALVATVQLKAVGRGTSLITLDESTINPFASQGKRITVNLGKAQITVRGK